ncbi:NAD(P)-dependent alcohol dehydrogenase [Vitiosangium sp. GDMCC 1.1324]|uniref:NAD(P)-dependent alcohol dehydrogenase n=1 Tax=Vitiosangium sp. (strain GDMCC 1.1324) TaxID=2138576 RepID=UPI000D3BAFB4|nr:NAD(P)-dependent alcohol dehydrogenase [Vitiosangium sp. GDMCC 1.1324]PTL84466.1 NAD(P)-dependent alcohol dehydrogenase [Vitiosangium sp. GDMCC 1.1324]
MKAIVYEDYGPPEVLKLQDVVKPVPGEGEILVRVRAAAVTTADSTFRKGDHFSTRLAFGLRRPRKRILGTELAGDVEAVGSGVTHFRPGDPVFAATGAAFGAHGEFVCLREDGAVARKPSNMTYDEAASLCDGAMTALPFLRDHGRVQRGQTVLVNGASGSVGSAAVQLARYYGAHVIAVCSTENVDRVRALGADEVIDYTREDFTRRRGAYHVVFDAVGKSSFSRCKDALTDRGIYLSTVPTLGMFADMLWTRFFGSRRALLALTGLRPPSTKRKDLCFLRELAEASRLRAVIDRRYPWEDSAQAHRRVDSGHKQGTVLLQMGA